jgi:microcystin-dependent protein
MANYAETSKNFTGQFMSGIQGVNTGIIIPWGSTSVPSGFLECDGSAVSRATYAALFAIVGTTYGSGNGSTTFNVPDLTDKTILSRSNNKALASTGGANTVANSASVGGSLSNTTLTTAQIPSHSHAQVAFNADGGGSGRFGGPLTRASSMTSGSAGGGGAHSHNLSATYTGDSTSVLQPYLTLIYIIKT